MCSPTLFLIGGTALTGAGQVQAGIAANKAGEANARIQTIMAADARDRGRADEAEVRRRNAGFIGRQAAGFGASGAEINTGSSLEILGDTAQLGELDALRIRNNAEREAFAFETGAEISRTQGQNARTSSFLSAGGTVLTGGSLVAERWQRFKADNPSGTFSSFLSS